MSWNYRVVKKSYPSKDEHGNDTTEIYYHVAEVYYNDPHDDATIWGMTQQATTVFAEDLDGLQWVLDRMQEALAKPVLDGDTIVYAKHKADTDEVD